MAGQRGLTTEERFWSKVKISGPDECWEWQGAIGNKSEGKRYGSFALRGKVVGAHRLSYEMTYGAIPPGFYVMHSCDNPQCVNPKHLSLGAQTENMRDMCVKGRSRRGEQVSRAKLTDADVRAMRKLYKSGLSIGAIARCFGVVRSNASCIVRGLQWKCVELEPDTPTQEEIKAAFERGKARVGR